MLDKSFIVNLPFPIISSPRSFLTPCDVSPPTIAFSFSSKVFLRLSNSFWNLFSTSSNFSFSSLLFFLSLMFLENSFLSTTTPLNEESAFSEASFTSPALSPKIALNSFSSGVGSDSPFGVIFPIRMSPGFTSAPILIIPFSSRSLVASSDTFGISAVSSSIPSLVSRTSKEYSSMWIEVNQSSRTTFSLITIASSKLYPFHGMNATTRFLPNANSPFSVAYPSQRT